jgi:surfeit locus 1 family protein
MKSGTKTARSLVPPLAAVVLVVLFAGLGLWQLDRADEKAALRELFESGAGYRPLSAGEIPELYEPLKASGRFLGERQFLIENMIMNGRIGYFVITPFEHAAGEPLLLVNRGWMPKAPDRDLAEAVAVAGSEQEITGRAGRLPRVGIRAGEAFEGDGGWPKTANWPTLEELEHELGRELLPFVLLADPEPDASFVRRWELPGPGPMRHIGYAFQWFALAAAVIVTALILWRRGRRPA